MDVGAHNVRPRAFVSFLSLRANNVRPYLTCTSSVGADARHRPASCHYVLYVGSSVLDAPQVWIVDRLDIGACFRWYRREGGLPLSFFILTTAKQLYKVVNMA